MTCGGAKVTIKTHGLDVRVFCVIFALDPAKGRVQMSHMDKEMAARYDPVFPEMGGLLHLKEVRKKIGQSLTNGGERSGRTFLHPVEAEHLRKILVLLGDDEEAKSTLMSLVTFAQMKSDVAG